MVTALPLSFNRLVARQESLNLRFFFLLFLLISHSSLITMSTPSKQLDPAHKYATPDPKKYGCFHCNFCGKITNGGVSRAKHHLAGGYNGVTLVPRFGSRE
ncbi:hypothetical protein Bca52824_089705 [Brassica carinata]|uniref:BED-type domain-containing protein n=2 Tax=Brassica carinata TaxID=52824 RepID=A0A8X7PG79_BRACI|nr:hypothetical protein Bca52824_089705 [Brassica carinata]